LKRKRKKKTAFPAILGNGVERGKGGEVAKKKRGERHPFPRTSAPALEERKKKEYYSFFTAAGGGRGKNEKKKGKGGGELFLSGGKEKNFLPLMKMGNWTPKGERRRPFSFLILTGGKKKKTQYSNNR